MGLRHILPWQINSIFIISEILSFLHISRKIRDFRDLSLYISRHMNASDGIDFPAKVVNPVVNQKRLQPWFQTRDRPFSNGILTYTAEFIRSSSSFASSNFTWVYVFSVTLISLCPIRYWRVFGFIQDFAMLLQ